MNDELKGYREELCTQADALGMESLTEEQQSIVLGIGIHSYRICTDGERLTHQEAAKVIQQLKEYPEVCENCDIKPCVLAEYLYG